MTGGRDARVGSGRTGGNYKAIRETYWDDLHFLKNYLENSGEMVVRSSSITLESL